MRRILLSTAAVLALITAASAADMPVRSVAPAPVALPPIYSWTGFYAGVHAGYIQNDVEARNLDPAIGLPSRVTLDQDGFTGGGQIGYNWQFGQVVTGVEADIAYTDVSRTRNIIIAPVTTSLSSDLEFLGTVRGRIGLAFPGLIFFAHSMYYITGGFAYGDVNNRGTITGPFLPFAGGRSDTRTGWTAGWGSEHSLTSNLTLQTQTLYYDLGDETIGLSNPFGTLRYRFANDGWVTRIGVNLRF